MFDNPYKPRTYLGTKVTFEKEPPMYALYRFRAKHRTYLVTLELFSFGLAAVKFCDSKGKGRSAFSKTYNEYDSFRVIGTALHVMRDYWKKNNDVSFCFLAEPRIWDKSISAKRKIAADNQDYKNARLNIFIYAIQSLFSPDVFKHLRGKDTRMYILVNIQSANKNKVSLEKMANYLGMNYYELFPSP